MSQHKECDQQDAVSDAVELSGTDAAEYAAAWTEWENNGEPIDWKYWVGKMPAWSCAQAAHLMCALDPDVSDRYSNRPHSSDPTKLVEKAHKIERLAKAQGVASFSPGDWIKWADENEVPVHGALRLASQKIERGRYTLAEVAAKIATASRAPADQVLPKLKAAALAGILPMYAPGLTARYVYGAGGHVRDTYEEAYWDDLNAWLDANEPRLDFAFPAPEKPTAAQPEVKQKPAGIATALDTPAPVQRFVAQDAAIIAEIVRQEYDPMKLPKHKPGKPGVKAAVRAALGNTGIWSGTTIFDKAWERLIKNGEIKIIT